MSFLTVITVLLLNHYWRRERQLQVDGWLPGWQHWLIQRRNNLPEFLRDWPWILPAMVITVPVLVLAVVLWLASGALFGLLSFGIHVLILVYCFARVNQQAVIEHYLDLWGRGNYEAAYLYANEQTPDAFSPDIGDYVRMHRAFLDALQQQAFRSLFAVLFWYILLGPLGAFTYWLTLNVWQQAILPGPYGERPLPDRLIGLLEWLPARLLAFSYALAGNFAEAFAVLKAKLLQAPDVDGNLALLTASASAAAGSSAVSDLDGSERAVRSLQALRDLLLRTQVVWVITLALLILVV